MRVLLIVGLLFGALILLHPAAKADPGAPTPARQAGPGDGLGDAEGVGGIVPGPLG